jgi:hypothetical protein
LYSFLVFRAAARANAEISFRTTERNPVSFTSVAAFCEMCF